VTVLEIAAGVAVLVIIVYDIFTSIVVPRPARRGIRLSAYLVRFTWPTWRNLFVGQRSEDLREAMLGGYAPAALILALLMWVVGLIVGFGLIVFALRWQIKPPIDSFWTALYVAGTSVLPIGGEYVPTFGVSRFVALFAAGSGLITFAIAISYIFLLFTAFQRRENFVIVLDASAGAPPSGVELLETHARLDICDDLATMFTVGQSWAAEILETHLAYPILNFFRSSHRDESWLGALGAVLDAATLQVTTVVGLKTNKGQAKLMIEVGTHLVEDLSHYFGITPERDAGVDLREFDAARERLAHAGFELGDRDESWRRFRALRGSYAMQLNAMAKFWAIPPAYWIGDRSAIGRH
jgi:hypothetical protein